MFSIVSLYSVMVTIGNEFPSLYSDPMKSLKYWEHSGDVSLAASANCPSSAIDSLPSFKGSKICVTDSHHSFYDGQYQWKYYSSDIQGSVYQHLYKNKVMYEFNNNSVYTYYFNAYDQNQTMNTRCIRDDIQRIFDCNGKWQNYYNKTWNIDTNIFVSTCNDVCLYNDALSLYPNTFTWYAFNQTNVYYCELCTPASYLYGYIDAVNDSYLWLIGPDPNAADAWNLCELNYNFTNKNTFNPLDCSGSWESFDNMIISECLSKINYQYSMLPLFEETQICIEDAVDSSWNGVYKWLYYDSFTNTSSYYNIHKNVYIYPEITITGERVYHIYVNHVLKARCNITNGAYEIVHCLGHWEMYDNNQWQMDVDMIITCCQDVCMNNSIFEWSGYNKTRKTNIYHCKQCVNDVYLYGWIYSSSNIYSWLIGSSPDVPESYYQCDIGNDLGHNYSFDLDDCLMTASWMAYDRKADMIMTKCGERCIQLESNSQIERVFVVDHSHSDLGIGFDFNIATIHKRLNATKSDALKVEYLCDNMDGMYSVLTVMDIGFPMTDIVYSLPRDQCDGTISVSIKFIGSSTDDTHIFMNNMYLYYNVSNTLFFDDMDQNDWSNTSQTAIGGFASPDYCGSDTKCYKMYVTESDYVVISKTFELNTNGYQYSDLNLEWSLITDGLINIDATLQVGIQCDKQYLYVYNMDILKQYNKNDDCTDGVCNVQSRMLPSGCAFSLQVIVQFSLHSADGWNEWGGIVYIDYVKLTHSQSLSSSTKSNQQSYSYLYHDRLNTLSNWEHNGNVSVASSLHCATIANDISSFNGDKMCVSNSYNALWDGQYEWQYYDKNVNGSIYYHTKSNKYIYQYIEADYYQYYINDYEQDSVIMTRCIVKRALNIRDCIGNWQNYYNNTWNNDTNIITTTCNDVCIHGNNHLYIPNGGVFEWIYYDNSRRTNVYYCQECGIYLYGIRSSVPIDLYWWLIGNTKADSSWYAEFDDDVDALNACQVGSLSELGDDYIFDVYDCLGTVHWLTYIYDHDGDTNGYEWRSDADLSLSICTTNTQYNELPSFQESQVCIEYSYNSSLDGVYKFLYYNSAVNSSIYYNKRNKMYIRPYINSTTDYQYHIHSHDAQDGMKVYAKCDVTDTLFDISECIGKWKEYYNNTWNMGNTTSTPCQDICINGNNIVDHEIIPLDINGIYEYQYFNPYFNSNVYYCDECSAYLYGVGDETSLYWVIGPDPSNFGYSISVCSRYGNVMEENKYMAKIDGCLGTSVWVTWVLSSGDFDVDDDMAASKCNPELEELCVELKSDSEISRSYLRNKSYEDVALGFDVNTALLSTPDFFLAQYSCNDDDLYYEVTTIGYMYNAITGPITNIVYKLPKESCDDTSSISVKFKLNGTNSVFIDNVYLYYNVSNEIYFSDMANGLGWIESSETALSGHNSRYCELNEKCYKLYLSSKINDVSISKAIDVSSIGYKYKDYNLEWSLKTNGLTDNAIFNVEIQCNNNYLYVYDLCILKQYNSKNDCTNNVCAVQSYNLPSECDLSSEIVIQFYLQSLSSSDEIYIDYVSLTHSVQSGNVSPLCRTASPTVLPTLAPITRVPSKSPTVPTTDPSPAPTKSPIKGPLTINEFAKTPEYLAVPIAGLLALLAILSIFIYCGVKMCLENKYKLEMAIKNAMVILITIGEYDDDPEDADPEIQYLSNLNILQDIVNLYELFGEENLNYSIYPQYDLKYHKMNWKQDELVAFLTEKAKQFNGGSDTFDGLVVAMSCHGMNNNICTSDYKLISKDVIHRIFSNKYAASREKPRVFLFDCCDGGDEQECRDDSSHSSCSEEAGKIATHLKTTSYSQDMTDEAYEQGKRIGVGDIDRDYVIWDRSERNPDHKLVQIHAANIGFQSKFNSKIGSYMLYEFCKKTLEDLNNDKSQSKRGGKCIFEIFDEIQQELEERGKQKIITTYNDKTRYIKFKKKIDDEMMMAIEMGDINNSAICVEIKF